MDIGTVAKRSGVPASTLRFYEEKRLITSIGRHGLRRLFAPEVLERLALIALGRSAGFSLEEIGRMFAAGARPRIDRRLLAAKADELDARIRELNVDGEDAASSSAPSEDGVRSRTRSTTRRYSRTARLWGSMVTLPRLDSLGSGGHWTQDGHGRSG